MFSGIVLGAYEVIEAIGSSSGISLIVVADAEAREQLKIGASVAINGVCLTAVESNSQGWIRFDVVPETLAKTNISQLKSGSKVNLERSLKFGDEIGGHLCSGHVDTTVTVASIKPIGSVAEIEFDIEPKFAKFILEKGFVALNGVSLTVAKKLAGGFTVAFIPETLSRTNLGSLKVGDKINLEIDRATQAIVETVEHLNKND